MQKLLVDTLCELNFNVLEYFIYYGQWLKRKISGMTMAEQLAVLQKHRDVMYNIPVRNGVGYDPASPHLRERLVKWTNKTINQIEAQQRALRNLPPHSTA